jgi:hypothetical protein
LWKTTISSATLKSIVSFFLLDGEEHDVGMRKEKLKLLLLQKKGGKKKNKKLFRRKNKE